MRKKDIERERNVLQVFATTSNLPNAGTHANVFLQLYKTSKHSSLIETFKFPLEHSKTHPTHKFRPGQTDLFEIELGGEDEEGAMSSGLRFDADNDLQKIRISTDAKPFVNAG